MAPLADFPRQESRHDRDDDQNAGVFSGTECSNPPPSSREPVSRPKPLSYVHRDHLLVYSVAVRPTEQGKGHGGALLDFADQRAAALGLAVIRLYTNLRMEKNIALYRRHGYAEIGTHPHPSRVGEVLVDMVRAVPSSAP
jgi:ribosomal protein S18 acetylase RimI-like enzyme